MINPVGCFSLGHWRFVYTHLYFLLCKENHENRIYRAGEKISQAISLFFRKIIAKFSCAKRLKDWTFLWYNSENSKLAGSKLASFHVCLHSFQCTLDQNNRFSKKCIRWKDFLLGWSHHLCLCFCCYQLGLCSVSHTANEYSIYYFCIIIKHFSISFSRVIIVQDFETVTFYALHTFTE